MLTKLFAFLVILILCGVAIYFLEGDRGEEIEDEEDETDDLEDIDDGDKEVDVSRFWYKIWKIAQSHPSKDYMRLALSDEEYDYWELHQDEFKFGSPILYNKLGQKQNEK
jgi:hypothetical protein